MPSVYQPEREAFLIAIRDATQAVISTVSVVETKMALFSREGFRVVVMLDDLLGPRRREIVSPSSTDVDAAYAPLLAFGKGNGHLAALNFGDVFAYALAKVRNIPLLYKGNDFAETDLRPALPTGHR